MTFQEFQASRSREYTGFRENEDWFYGCGDLQIWNWEGAPSGPLYEVVAPKFEFELTANDFDWIERRLYELAWQFGYLDPMHPTFH